MRFFAVLLTAALFALLLTGCNSQRTKEEPARGIDRYANQSGLFSIDAAHQYKDSSRIGKIVWNEHPDSPIIVNGAAGSWNEKWAATGISPLIFLDGSWWLYHGGIDFGGTDRIGALISSGSSISGPWSDPAENPILDIGAPGAWDDTLVDHPSVIAYNGELLMYYGGHDGTTWRIGLAKSRDGINWLKSGSNPVLSPGTSGAWDGAGVGHPSVIYDGSRFVMAYRGWKVGDPDTRSRIGIATSDDGINWQKLAGTPVLGYGGSGEWDEYGLLAPRLWVEDGRYYMNYSGKYVASQYSSVGHAYSDSLVRWTKDSNNPMIDHNAVPYIEIEWATPARIGQSWFLLTPAYFDGGVTALWVGR